VIGAVGGCIAGRHLAKKKAAAEHQVAGEGAATDGAHVGGATPSAEPTHTAAPAN
jgi:hypothetical protein